MLKFFSQNGPSILTTIVDDMRVTLPCNALYLRMHCILQVFIKQMKFVEDFRITDIKLLLCTIACSFSLFALGYDYISPFPKSVYVLATCAISYPNVRALLHCHVHP